MSFADANVGNLDVQSINWTPIANFPPTYTLETTCQPRDTFNSSPLTAAPVPVHFERKGSYVTCFLPVFNTHGFPLADASSFIQILSPGTVPLGYRPALYDAQSICFVRDYNTGFATADCVFYAAFSSNEIFVGEAATGSNGYTFNAAGSEFYVGGFTLTYKTTDPHP